MRQRPRRLPGWGYALTSTTGGLRERIAEQLGHPGDESENSARRLDEAAKVLMHAAERASTIKPVIRLPMPPPLPPRTQPRPASSPYQSGRGLEPEPEMPQILQSRSIGSEPIQIHAQQRYSLSLLLGERAALAPAVLVLSLAVVVVLLLVSAAELARWPGLAWIGGEPATKGMNVSGFTASAGAGGSFDAGGRGVRIPNAPEMSLDERALLQRVQAMIAQGDFDTARAELARPASNGSSIARFALAETFDPNMLAAWGRREPVGDVGVARSLYEQTIPLGDPRAKFRIDALAGEQ